MSLVSRYLDPVLIERLNHLQLSARRVVAGMTPQPMAPEPPMAR